METLKLKRIKSAVNCMPGGIGGMIRYAVEEISHPHYAELTDSLQAKASIQLDINVLSGQGLEHGEFISSFVVLAPGSETPELVTVRGSYMVVPDYRLLRRIVRWKYNYDATEAISPEDFREEYGTAFGDHFYGKWLSFGGDIVRMIAYFADNIDKGQAFLSIVMRRGLQYETRIS